MAFAIRNLSVLAYANGFTLWHYKTSVDTLGTAAGDYFADAQDMLTAGDMMVVNAKDGARIMVVASVDAAAVITAPLG